MTNGENLKNIYPDLEIISEIKDVYVIILEDHNVWSPKLEVFKSWWNAEYNEPIKALEQEPKSEWQHDHEILRAYSDGANNVIDQN